MARVTFLCGKKKTVVENPDHETPILRIGLEHGVPIEHACGGNGLCTTCMCRITEGMENVTPRSEREELMGVTEDPYRLTCQSKADGKGDIVVEVPE